MAFNTMSMKLMSPVLLVACVLLATACQRQPENLPRLDAVVGQPFPAVTLQRPSGNDVPLKSLRGKVVVLNVWATWCPPCRREMPSLDRLSRTLDPQRFAVVGLSTDKDQRLAMEFLLQNGITFANFHDRDSKLETQFDLNAFPETFLIAPDGTLLQRIVGFREWDSPETVAQLEDAYLNYQTVHTRLTK